MCGGLEMEIPIIDIGPLMKGDIKSSDVINQIGQAVQKVGFFYISGYDDENQLCSNMFDVGKKIFDLSTDDKNEISIKNSQVFRGFVQKGDDITNHKADVKEGIYFGHETSPEEGEDEIMMKGYNQYPATIPHLPGIINDYIAKMTHVGNVLVNALAVKLGQKENLFDEMFAVPFPLLALWHYPPHPEDSGDWGIGPHTDYGVITLILQDDVGGLQAQTRDGEWIDVTPFPGTQVVLFGDVLEIWTRGYFKATKHRVKNSPTATRISVPFFHQPSASTIVTPLDIQLPSDFDPTKTRNPPPPFQFGRYVKNKFETSYLN